MSLWPDSTTNPIGLSHVLGYQLGSPYSIPHGICSCLTLALTISAMAKHGSDSELAGLSALLPHVDAAAHRRLEQASPMERTEAVAQAIKSLVADLGLTSKLSTYNVPQEDLPGIGQLGIAALDWLTSRGSDAKLDGLQEGHVRTVVRGAAAESAGAVLRPKATLRAERLRLWCPWLSPSGDDSERNVSHVDRAITVNLL
jgi:hypothetical protein